MDIFVNPLFGNTCFLLPLYGKMRFGEEENHKKYVVSIDDSQIYSLIIDITKFCAQFQRQGYPRNWD